MTRQTKAKTQRKASTSSPTRKRTAGDALLFSFETTYPTIAQWVQSYGWIEVGQDDHSRSMVRALDIGGIVWEGKAHYASIDELWRDLEKGLMKWMAENG